jgi:hypothetical protein
VCVTPNLQMGVTMGATTLGMWFAFAGFLIQRPYMPPWWKWFSYLCPPAWSIYAIVVDQLGDKVCLACQVLRACELCSEAGCAGACACAPGRALLPANLCVPVNRYRA